MSHLRSCEPFVRRRTRGAAGIHPGPCHRPERYPFKYLRTRKASSPRRGSVSPSMRVRAVALRLHLVVGVLTGGALLILGLSGAVLVLRPELDGALQIGHVATL